MKVEDLSNYDIELIRSMAIDDLRNSPGWDPTKSMMKILLNVIHLKGYNIVKDPTRESTMEGPKKSWYNEAAPKKPWSY